MLSRLIPASLAGVLAAAMAFVTAFAQAVAPAAPAFLVYTGGLLGHSEPCG